VSLPGTITVSRTLPETCRQSVAQWTANPIYPIPANRAQNMPEIRCSFVFMGNRHAMSVKPVEAFMRAVAYLFAVLALYGCEQVEKVGQVGPATRHPPHDRGDVVCVNVPPGYLADTTRVFDEQADISFLIRSEERYNRTRAMKKCGAIESLLKEMLANTGLEVTYVERPHDGPPAFVATRQR
jgi:hypothetical protein